MGVPTKAPPVRKIPRILTASGAKLDKESTTEAQRRSQTWQTQAFSYVRRVPELNYSSRFYKKFLPRLRLFPALRDEQDRLTPIESGLPVDLLDRVQDPGGGRSALLGNYGRLMFIAGEGYLLGLELETEREGWYFVSKNEVELLGNDAIRHKSTSASVGKEYSASEAVAYRFWTPDPEFSGDAESPMQAIIDVAEELVALTGAVRATAFSRMLNGILKVPAELSFGADEEGTDEDAEQNVFLANLIDHIMGVIDDPGSPGALAPFIAEGESEFLAALDWIAIHDPQNDYLERELRKEAVDRAAHGLDFPAEYLKSFSDTNHWSARAITHEMWRTHGAPMAEQFCDDLSESYMRPALREVDYPDWRNVVIGYDDSKVTVPADRSEDADRAADRGMISDKGYRVMKGIEEDHKPSEVEKKIYLAGKLREPAFLEDTPYEIEEPEPAPMPPGPVPSQNGQPDPEEGPPPPGPSGVSREESRAAAINGAAYAALYRCRELAGSKIRQGFKSKTRGKAPELETIDGCKNSSVAATLGQECIIEAEMATPIELVRHGADGFAAICLEWGIDEAQAASLAQNIEVFASRTLFEMTLPAFPAGFFAQILRACEVSSELGEEGTVRRNNEALARLERMLPGTMASIARG